MRRRRARFVALALVLCGAQAAAQQPDPTLETRYQRGADLRDQHQDAQALAVFEEIYAQSREPRALAQVGMAEGALGRWLDAEQHLATALNTPDAWVATRRAALESALATIRTHLGQLEVQSSTPNAEVWIEGRRIGSANTPLRVLAGTAQFELRAPGHVTVSRVATVPAGGLAREALPPLVTAVAPSGTSTVVATTPTPAVAVTTAPTPVVAGTGSTRRTLAIASLVAGGVLLAGGVGAWAYGWTVASDYNNDATCPAPGAAMIPAACQSRLDAARVVEPLGWVGMITGAALVATGAVLLGTMPRSSGERVVRVVPGPGDLGAGLRVSF